MVFQMKKVKLGASFFTYPMPVMLVGTYREVELDEALPLHETLLRLTRRRLGRD